MCPGKKATCSVSAKKISGFLFKVILPIILTGTISSGINFVGSNKSKSNLCSSSSATIWTPNSHSGKWPASIASHKSRRWKSESAPLIFTASSQVTECTPNLGFQWNFTKWDCPLALINRKVWIPNPSIILKLRGIARSLMAQIWLCNVSVACDTKS